MKYSTEIGRLTMITNDAWHGGGESERSPLDRYMFRTSTAVFEVGFKSRRQELATPLDVLIALVLDDGDPRMVFDGEEHFSYVG